jgi:AraC-like DNA-binding protein
MDRVQAAQWWRDPDLGLEQLAQRLGTNTSYVSRALNDGLGLSFNEAINRLRVEAVCAELRAGSTRPLLAIAFDAGFNSKTSFNRCFKELTGTTPSRFRAGPGPEG